MTDSNKVRILYLNLVLVSTSAELVKPLYNQQADCSRYQEQVQYPAVLVHTSTVVPGTPWYIPVFAYPNIGTYLYKVPGTSTQYWYIPILRPGTSYQVVPLWQYLSGTRYKYKWIPSVGTYLYGYVPLLLYNQVFCTTSRY